MGLAQVFDPFIEAPFRQQVIEFPVKHVPGRFG
jgi:hypothetical protein